MTDTIFALATAPGRAAVAVVRVSGPGTRVAMERLGAGSLRPRRATPRTLHDATGGLIDRALALWFPAPDSYTGEDCGELHVHGGSAVVDAVSGALSDLGARLAAPGEFTRRAFENGKLDLGQAEAVADLIDAESVAQARQAAAQLSGALGERYKTWRQALVRILGQLEAAVDFPDEEIPTAVETRASGPLTRLIGDLDAALIDGRRGRRVRDGYRVAIIGAPNAGKSSLLNLLLCRDAAIVTDTPGTTRDVIEAPLDVGGYHVLLADMAGLRDTRDAVEAEGVRRARAWAASADLRLWVIDRASLDDSWREARALVVSGDLAIVNKADLPPSASGRAAAAAARALGLETATVSLTSWKAAAVWERLSARVLADLAGGDFPATTRVRHARHLASARAHLDRALAMLNAPELAAEDVRLAGRELAMVTGEIGVEDVLGEVFASFCIGK